MRSGPHGRILPLVSKSPPKTPQEKKALSLTKDRRNTYGNNVKAARRLIPFLKAKESRRNRHKNNQAIAVIDRVVDEASDLTESSARQDVHRAGGWKKFPDDPLGEVVAGKLETRERRIGRKSRSRARDLSDPKQLTALLANLPSDEAT